MDRTTNAALRLHRILLALRGTCRDGRPIRDALGEVFDLDPADDLALRRQLVLLDDLFAQSQAAIAAIPGLDLPRYLRYFPAARKGLPASTARAATRRRGRGRRPRVVRYDDEPRREGILRVDRPYGSRPHALTRARGPASAQDQE